jgi:hypothetical protein
MVLSNSNFFYSLWYVGWRENTRGISVGTFKFTLEQTVHLVAIYDDGLFRIFRDGILVSQSQTTEIEYIDLGDQFSNLRGV